MRLLLAICAKRLVRLAEYDLARARACRAWQDEAQDRAEVRLGKAERLLAHVRALTQA